MYFVMGWAFIHFCGRPFASVDNVAREFALPLLAIAVFVMSYELFDVMGVGLSAIAHANAFNDGKTSERYTTPVADLPPAYVCAVRAQANQVEQVPFFTIMLLGAVLFADGLAVGTLGVLYCGIRALYARAYRTNGLGASLAAYTIPCYFILGPLAMANIVGALKLLSE